MRHAHLRTALIGCCIWAKAVVRKQREERNARQEPGANPDIHRNRGSKDSIRSICDRGGASCRYLDEGSRERLGNPFGSGLMTGIRLGSCPASTVPEPIAPIMGRGGACPNGELSRPVQKIQGLIG